MLWRGRFHCDNQMVMGSVPSSEIGTRLSGTAILIVQARFDYEWPKLAKSLPPDLLVIIENWQGQRASVYGQNPDQLRPFNFAFVQDDWVAVAMGKELLAVVLKLIDIFVYGELRIVMSDK